MLTVSIDRNKISSYLKAAVTVSSDEPVKAYEARATKTDKAYGKSIGYDLLSDDASAVNGIVTLDTAVTSFTFDVESDELSSDGEYRISVYVLNENGVWSDCCQLYTRASEAVIDSNGAKVLAKRDGSGTDESYISAYSGTDINAFITEVLL